ncbi:MAG: ATP-dependent DNA helicase RecG [Desulfitobacteriaceae bacterium]
MVHKQQQVVLNNLRRAFLTEEKQGYTNTSVFGGFHALLLGMIPRLEQLFPGVNFSPLKQIAKEYQVWGLIKRHQGLIDLASFFDKLVIFLEHDNSVLASEIPLKEQVRPESVDKVIIPKQKVITKQIVSTKQPGDTELQYIKGIGPQRFKQLQKAGINNIEDLLMYYPRRYEDRCQVRLSQLKDGDYVTVVAKVIANQVTNGRIKVIKLTLEQEGHLAYAVWFNQQYIIKQFPPGTLVTVTGKVRCFQRVPEIIVRDITKPSMEEAGLTIPMMEIIPVYSETESLSSNVFRNIIKSVLQYTNQYFLEFLRKDDQSEWMDRGTAHREVHFPTSRDSLHKARERLVWEEVLFLQLAVARMRLGLEQQESPPLSGGGDLVKQFFQTLPFQLTSAQDRVIQEIFRDMKGNKRMTRLVQGDVGSGKTAVAMAALLQAVGSGYQGAMMVPTEILAWQHYHSLVKAFKPLGVTVAILLGSQKRADREANQLEIADGRAQVIVGTHALIQENITFKALGLAVTDEQHRFGVRQRTLLQHKGENSHVLVLTATPIPRSLALTLYGDLQLSVLDELPVGRKPVLTRILSERGRPNLEKFLGEQLALGRQVFVVCPLVEESEVLDVTSATNHAIYLQERYPERSVILIHGKMKGAEKETIMLDFLARKIDILVATTVVEVGVNIPNATVMVVEGAERFGLAQLHQLRGRVGRGSEQSYCILMTEVKNSNRLNILCQSNNGFKIAEEDLRLRGPGELMGTRQHGLPELRLADPVRDAYLIEKSYLMTQKILQNPQEYSCLLQEVEHCFSAKRIGLH